MLIETYCSGCPISVELALVKLMVLWLLYGREGWSLPQSVQYPKHTSEMPSHMLVNLRFSVAICESGILSGLKLYFMCPLMKSKGALGKLPLMKLKQRFLSSGKGGKMKP